MSKDNLSIKVFLSHRYKSAEVNLYFFELFSKIADIQFDIDIGMFSTNVTKLERMIRDTDAFIGIYPYDEGVNVFADKEKLLSYSKYFRLELNMALRSKKPTFIFVDKRYRNLLKVGGKNKIFFFDIKEVLGEGLSPSKTSISDRLSIYLKNLNHIIKYEKSTYAYNHEKSKIGLLLPENKYSSNLRDSIIEEIENHAKDVEIIKYPIFINERFISELDEIDFVIMDSSIDPVITSFFHGYFIPTLKIAKKEDDFKFFDSIFNLYEVGYRKDIIYWENEEDLISEINERMINIFSPKKRISTYNEASKYFNSASLRKETIFVSYSSVDADIAQETIRGLKKKFQTVFDYRDGGDSIIPGQPWIQEIFDSLSKSSIGIPLYSNSYFKSGNCMHELNQMAALKDNNNLLLLPIKITNEKIDNMPNQIQDIQYIRQWEYENTMELVNKLVESIDKNKNGC